MEFKRSNIGKPRHKGWKLASRFLVLTLPAYMTIIATMPIADENIKLWLNIGLGLIVATVQGLSELTVDKTEDNGSTV